MASGNAPRAGRTRARTLFLSDIHLGYRHARTRELNEFLAGVEAETIVLVGDIVDALSLARRAFWSPEHTQVVRTLLARQRAGARLVYIPGNHDASLAMLAQMLRGQFEVHREWVHRTAAGERLLVLHGDQFDGVVHCAPWLQHLGDFMHGTTVGVSHHINNLRRRLGKPYWPMTEGLKLRIGVAARYIENFERLAAAHARTQGYDGVVCGHIHRARLSRIEGTLYANTGDWVESCSALAESEAGELSLVRWPGRAAGALRARGALLADPA
ncbi:MAG TPA: UDP-2,3-diacylglucosamine diphosphatase [Steroidobacteraceae bacterium]|nr:UDP-2,3-diacylglucosamine diphosphatase [Steroidobacteraceae bacterium]